MDLTAGPFLKNTTLKKIILHLFVLEDVVAFDLGCLTASVFTFDHLFSFRFFLQFLCCIQGGFSHSSSIFNVVCVYEGFCLSVFSDLRLDLSFSAP